MSTYRLVQQGCKNAVTQRDQKLGTTRTFPCSIHCLGVVERHNTSGFVKPAAQLIALGLKTRKEGYEFRSWIDKFQGIMPLCNPKVKYQKETQLFCKCYYMKLQQRKD